MRSLKDTFTMHNGIKIPCVGFGTFLTPDGEIAENAVLEALKIGYRHIDTASYYRNERSVGEAVRKSGLPRSEVFVTSKLWNSDQGYESTLKAFDKTMKELRLDYLDLYLIHWPKAGGRADDWVRLNRETWQAMEELYEDGRIKSIGVSNFQPHHIESLMEMSNILPMVNQIELHPGLNQTETVEFCRANNIIVESWGPFAHGKIFGSGLLDEIAARHGKSVAQVCLRWLSQQEILPLPKSITPVRIKENADIFDFELSRKDMEYISGIRKMIGTGWNSDEVAW